MILMLAILLVVGMPMCFAAQDDVDGEVAVIIKTDDGSTRPPTRPRMPAYRPLTCVYDTDTAVLTVSSRNLPIVSVDVWNLTTNEVFSTSCNGYYSALQLSGTAGAWQVTITLEDGSIHVGSFDI